MILQKALEQLKGGDDKTALNILSNITVNIEDL